jgi:putative ABC transport system permease protein
MTLREALASALANLASHKLRSLLTMLGMIFGVGAVIAMLSIGEGAERRALAMIQQMGLDNILVRSAELEEAELQEVRKKSLGVSFRDVAAIEEAVPGVEVAAPRVEVSPYKVFAAQGRTEAEVFGVSHQHRALMNLSLVEGRFFDRADVDGHAQVAVIGADVRQDLFGFGTAVGERVKVNDVWLRVIGVLAPAGAGEAVQGVAVGSPDSQILLPATTAQRKFDHNPLASPLDEIVVRIGPGVEASNVAELVDGLVGRLHGGAEDYEVVVPEALLEQSRRTQRLFNLVMGAIAGISLLVGGIGIMNIMLATVLERTREIGVRRAVGARARDIRYQFVVEAFAISLLGGVAGVAAGVLIAWGVAASAGWETVVTPGAIFLATGVAITVGLVSGFYPAHRASLLDPIDSLRYE